MRLILPTVAALLLPCLSYSVHAQDVKFPPEAEQIPGPSCSRLPNLWIEPPGPCQPGDNQAWLADIAHWRRERLIRIGFDPSEYDRPELKWAQSSFIQPQVMIEERYLFDPESGKYTVDRYLDDLEKRYGGIDSVLLWHIYPNLGVDGRNQYDMLRDMAGGLEAVKQMVADFHRRGVRVLFPVVPWDQGTRDEGAPIWIATAK